MKKTLIALMALAGVASAYDVWTFDATTADKNGTVTTAPITINIEGFGQTSTTAVTYVDGSYSYVVAPEGSDFSTGSGATSNAFTLMTYVNFDTITSGTEYFIFGTGETNGGGTAINYIGGQLSLSQKTKSHNTTTGVSLEADTWYHIALAYDGSDNSMDVFVNGELQKSITLTGDYVAPSNSKIYFGAGSTNGGQDDFAGSIAQFQIVQGVALGASDIKAIAIPAAPETPSVPEPATATLSLLALAGLAARRRRK